MRKLTRTVSRVYDQHLAAAGLKVTQYSLLVNIGRTPGPLAELANRLSLERTTLSRNLKPLLDAGWVQVVPGADSRTRIVSLTAAGRATVCHARRAWEAAQAAVHAALGAEQVAALHAMLASSLIQLSPLLEESGHADPD
ncbi:MarR family winged helix-turn-helix transcriptional regulator [Massilia sp. TS11]|uniref:MarR family winged helix-turn-helix transcriptional regulator n=1 Tax=Massilia sp. TS11 TaxID=2908003 RepID=UPI001EDA5045|nr:MarR family winged helix-turn-helix transcriptional regulator [Massilia sp. TS11]MCG2583249.1 MarR family winged helix-turn-helix transcriptional regulator [Massilia sp. TS11]